MLIKKKYYAHFIFLRYHPFRPQAFPMAFLYTYSFFSIQTHEVFFIFPQIIGTNPHSLLIDGICIKCDSAQYQFGHIIINYNIDTSYIL